MIISWSFGVSLITLKGSVTNSYFSHPFIFCNPFPTFPMCLKSRKKKYTLSVSLSAHRRGTVYSPQATGEMIRYVYFILLYKNNCTFRTKYLKHVCLV